MADREMDRQTYSETDEGECKCKDIYIYIIYLLFFHYASKLTLFKQAKYRYTLNE